MRRQGRKKWHERREETRMRGLTANRAQPLEAQSGTAGRLVSIITSAATQQPHHCCDSDVIFLKFRLNLNRFSRDVF